MAGTETASVNAATAGQPSTGAPQADGTLQTAPAGDDAASKPPTEPKSNLSLLEQARLASLSTLSLDPGLIELVPYLIRWMAESIETTITVSLGGGAKPSITGAGADLSSTVGIGIGKDVVGRERAMGKMGRMTMGWLVEGMDALSRNDSLFIEPYVSV
jgi:hypothetical protein